MRKTCVQAVQYAQKSVQKLCTKCMQFFTQVALSPKPQNYAQVCTYFVQDVVHTILMRFTEVLGALSPLSTGLIIERNMDINKYLKESCGKPV